MSIRIKLADCATLRSIETTIRGRIKLVDYTILLLIRMYGLTKEVIKIKNDMNIPEISLDQMIMNTKLSLELIPSNYHPGMSMNTNEKMLWSNVKPHTYS